MTALGTYGDLAKQLGVDTTKPGTSPVGHAIDDGIASLADVFGFSAKVGK